MTPGATGDSFQCVQSLKLNEASRAKHWHNQCQVRAGTNCGLFPTVLAGAGLLCQSPEPEIRFASRMGVANVWRWSGGVRRLRPALAIRSRIVLCSGEGLTTWPWPPGAGWGRIPGAKWRRRFLEHRLDGLVDDPRARSSCQDHHRPGRGRCHATLESMPRNATHSSLARLTERPRLSKSTIGRIRKAFEPKPHRADASSSPMIRAFWRRSTAWEGLYLNPPESAVVLSMDEKSQVQALARSRPAFPMMPGTRHPQPGQKHGTRAQSFIWTKTAEQILESIG